MQMPTHVGHLGHTSLKIRVFGFFLENTKAENQDQWKFHMIFS